MSFNIIADEILYEGRTVGFFVPNLGASFRSDVETELLSHVSDSISEEDHLKEMREVEDDYQDQEGALRDRVNDLENDNAQLCTTLHEIDEMGSGDIIMGLQQKIDQVEKDMIIWRDAYNRLMRQTVKSKAVRKRKIA